MDCETADGGANRYPFWRGIHCHCLPDGGFYMNAKINADLNHDGVVDAEELAAVDQHHKVETQTRIALPRLL